MTGSYTEMLYEFFFLPAKDATFESEMDAQIVANIYEDEDAIN